MKSCEKKRNSFAHLIYPKLYTRNIKLQEFIRRVEFLPVQSSFFPIIPFPYFIAKVPDAMRHLRFDRRSASTRPLFPPRLFIGGGESRSSAGNRVRPPFLLPSHPTLWFPPILIPPRPYFSTDPTSSSFVFLPFFPLHRGDCSSLRDRIFT